MPEYRIQYKLTAATTWTDGPLVDTGSATTGSVDVTGLTNGSTYDIRVVRPGTRTVVSRNTLQVTPTDSFENVLTNPEAGTSSGDDATQVGTYNGQRGVLVSMKTAGSFIVYYSTDGTNFIEFGRRATNGTLTNGTAVATKSYFFPFPADVTVVKAIKVVITKGSAVVSLEATIV